jgi:hypothetical protein
VGLAFGGHDMVIRTKSYAGSISGSLWRRIRGGLILTLALAASADGGQAVGGATAYERQPVLKASQLVPAELLKGARFQVDETVPTDGFLARFTIEKAISVVFSSYPIEELSSPVTWWHHRQPPNF